MTQQNELLLFDSLDQVISDPLGRNSWRRFASQAVKISDHEIYRQVARRIVNEVDAHGLAGFHRAIFLGHTLGMKGEIGRAGKVLEELRPIHVDRLMSFINYEWANILAEAQSRSEFVRLMDAANIPRLMEIANICVQKNAPVRTTAISPQIKRIAIYTPQLLDLKHPPTKMVFEQTRMLQLLDFEVRIFSCQEQSIPDMREYLSNDGRLNLPPSAANIENDVKFSSTLDIVRIQERFSLPLRAQSALQMIKAFEPDLCFFVGHQSLLLKSLFQQYPILGLNISSIAPSGDLDLWLSADIEAKDAPQDAHNHAYYHPFRTIKKAAQSTIHRDELGVAADAIVLLTVGSRLEKEITGDWALAMLDVCARFPKLVWLVVGGNGVMPTALQSANAANIKSLPHQENLKGIYACCDIYVNPPRLGGGFSVAEAMAEGLSSLAFADTDGGKKLGALAARDSEDYFTELVQLINEPTARETKAKEMIAIFNSSINLDNSAPSLLRAITLTHEKYQQRMTNAS